MDKVEQEKYLSELEEVAAKNGTPENPAAFDQWVVSNFGLGLYDVFLKNYNKKFWTVDPNEMNSAWVGERVALPNITKSKGKMATHDNMGRWLEIPPGDKTISFAIRGTKKQEEFGESLLTVFPERGLSCTVKSQG